MYLVDCPNCGRSLRMKRAVNEAKLKCRYCQAVFIGSTRPSPEAPLPEASPPEPASSAGAPQPDDAPRHHHGSKPRRSAWPAGIAILCLAGAVVLGAWLFHNLRQDTPPEPEVESIPGVSTRPADAPVKPPATDQPGDKPASPTGAAVTPKDAKKNGETENPVEVIDCTRLSGPSEASATFVGTYENHSSQVLRWVQVIVTVAQPKGNPLRASSIQYKNIPPGWQGKFNVDAAFRFEPGMRIDKVEARSEPAPELRGWVLKGWLKDVTDEDTILITGEANNTTKQPLLNPVVWCDFFTRRGLYVGSAKGKFHGNGRPLAPGASRAYEIHFDPRQTGSSSRLLAEPQLRLLGKAKNPDTQP